MDRLHLSQHISQYFNAELVALTRQVLAMGGLVESQFATALEALAERDARRTADVIAREEVNASELEIDARCTQISRGASRLHRILRLVLACVRMVTNLERIGDEAERIAKLSEKLGSIDLGERYTMKLAEMGSLVRDQLRAHSTPSPAWMKTVRWNACVATAKWTCSTRKSPRCWSI
ncbi:hypothetical protein PEC18_19325 [Paucibacter sp. O1-1]|nr:hypothetical protein [Paucibacter sp. O1-1]MDA3827939.1 hypothetical protein [Paucibacter sp. O1-1]